MNYFQTTRITRHFIMIKSISFKIHSFAAPSHSDRKKKEITNICINIANIIHFEIYPNEINIVEFWSIRRRCTVHTVRIQTIQYTHVHKKKCTKYEQNVRKVALNITTTTATTMTTMVWLHHPSIYVCLVAQRNSRKKHFRSKNHKHVLDFTGAVSDEIIYYTLNTFVGGFFFRILLWMRSFFISLILYTYTYPVRKVHFRKSANPVLILTSTVPPNLNPRNQLIQNCNGQFVHSIYMCMCMCVELFTFSVSDFICAPFSFIKSRWISHMNANFWSNTTGIVIHYIERASHENVNRNFTI